MRLADQPALKAASETGRPLILLYILEEGPTAPRPPGGASLWWLDKSLRSLSEGIEKRGGQLTLRRGPAQKVLKAVIEETGATHVFWNRRYDATGRKTDEAIKSSLKKNGIEAQSSNGRLLTEPWEITTGSGAWYKVFTPYWKRVRELYQNPAPLAAPKDLSGPAVKSDKLDDWALHPSRPDWSAGFSPVWTPGEASAKARLKKFLDGPVETYADDRNRPDLNTSTSGLSPHLRFGEISPHAVWRAVMANYAGPHSLSKGAEVFLSELVWREFSYVLLFNAPDLTGANYNTNFDHMPWRTDKRALTAWQKGMTGYPMVDAGMRQLWHTGWMHNRLRMIVASFLTKHLLLDWREGEDWFWDTLVDADPAANPASWQWVAGSGADAAPYFRVFNPITQGEKFDVTSAYVREWCPELAHLPEKFLYSPWTAPLLVLKEAGVTLGKNYPQPIVTHELGRERALEAYATLKEKAAQA